MAAVAEHETDRWNAVGLDASDNVAVALAELSGFATVLVQGRQFGVRLSDDIPMGHKLAIKSIAKGEAVIKYGQAIGKATVDIPVGAHVHVQNLTSARGGPATS